MTETKNQFNLVKFLTKYAMVIALVVVFILFSVLTKGTLLSSQNMTNLMLQNGYVLVMACGMLLCILTGGNIDLSVGSVVCVVGGVAAVMISNMHLPAVPVILLCLLAGLVIGCWQGYWIGYVRIPPFITTLCGLLCAARVGSVNGSTGTSFEMDAIGSCFIGGASAYGGSGTVGGVVIGALLLGVINMGMSIMGLGDAWQYVIKGGVLLLAVIFDVVTNRKSGSK